MKWCFVLLIIATSCMTTPANYEYADGNANVYIITPTELRYVPVTPEESSSGTYSGGEPKNIAISPAQFQTLEALFEKALNNTETHIENRVMMSGLVSRTGSNKKQSILKPGSTDIATIEEELKKILTSE
jgi:hypothetical protein